MSDITVLVNTPVRTGDLLGYSGNEGCSDRVYLHVELVRNVREHISWWGKSIVGRESPAGPSLTWLVNAENAQAGKELNSGIETRPPIHPLQNWTMDENNNRKTSFARGEAIRYAAEVRNLRDAEATATFTFLARGPDEIFRWEGNVTVSSGGCCLGLARYFSPSIIPTSARPGTYHLEVLITYTGPDIDNQTRTFAAQAAPFTVR